MKEGIFRDYYYPELRSAYHKRRSSFEGCVFCIACEILKKHKTPYVVDLSFTEVYVIKEYGNFILVVNPFPYSNGHCEIVTKRHIKDYMELREKEIEEITSLILPQLLNSMEKEYSGRGKFHYNIGLNVGPYSGASMEHLHFHVVPRPKKTIENVVDIKKYSTDTMYRLAKHLYNIDSAKEVLSSHYSFFSKIGCSSCKTGKMLRSRESPSVIDIGKFWKTRQVYVVKEYETCFVEVNERGYNSGHVKIVPKRHVSEYRELKKNEIREIFLAVLPELLDAMKKEYSMKDGSFSYNFGMGTKNRHLQLELLPRVRSDAGFMETTLSIRVMPESPKATMERLAKHLFKRKGII